MVILEVYQATVGLLFLIGIPISDTLKYCILGISVILLLLSLGILAWQMLRCYTHRCVTHTHEGTVSSDLLHPSQKLTAATNNTGAPGDRVYGKADLRRQDPSLESSKADMHMEEKANIKKVDGSLQFSIRHEHLQSRLVVTVLWAESLMGHNQNQNPQLFVKLSLMWAGSKGVDMEAGADDELERTAPVLWTVLQEWQTRIVKGSCNPLFGDKFSCILHKKLDDVKLKLEVRDFDKFSRHTVLGQVRVPLGKLNISNPLHLKEGLHIPQKDLVGEVLLTLKFLPTTQRLEIGLLKVRTAAPTEECSDAALYAKISVQYNQCKLRYQKTSTVSQSLVTVFNEVLMFPLPEFSLQECKIAVSVYKTRMTKNSTKHLIGQLTVGKEKELEDKHWGLMMHSIRQPVAMWHGLQI